MVKPIDEAKPADGGYDFSDDWLDDFFDEALSFDNQAKSQQTPSRDITVPDAPEAAKSEEFDFSNLDVEQDGATPDDIEMELDGKLKASFPYNVAAPTYVYIYAGQAGATVKGYGVPTNGGGGELKIYGIQVNNDTPVGIADVQHKPSSTTIYNLSGQRLARPQRGLNIINGHKVAIK